MMVVTHFLTGIHVFAPMTKATSGRGVPPAPTHRCAHNGLRGSVYTHTCLGVSRCSHVCTYTNSRWMEVWGRKGQGTVNVVLRGLLPPGTCEAEIRSITQVAKGDLQKFSNLWGPEGDGAQDTMTEARRPCGHCEVDSWSGVGAQGQSYIAPGLPSWPPLPMAPICMIFRGGT